MRLDALYHKSKSGSIWSWSVWTEGNIIKTEHGLLNGAKQISERVAEAKNVGKANATSDNEQAEAEARSMWTYQRDRKYRESIKAAETDELALPMLAKSKAFKHGDKLDYPVDVQPKYDGVRCLAFWENGEVKLTSRNGKPWIVPHIQKALVKFLPGDCVLDGELYVHGVGFQTITSWVKKLQKNTEQICYHVYDCPEANGVFLPWEKRLKNLEVILACNSYNNKVCLAPTQRVMNEEDILKAEALYVAAGFEGAIIRKLDGTYRYGYRSNDLLKVKSFMDDEFEVVNYKTGELGTKEANAVIWICRTKDGKEFAVRPRGSVVDREQARKTAMRRLGHLYKVKFFEYTDDGLPRFPVGLGFRDSFDM
jgi:DNA ligase-1